MEVGRHELFQNRMILSEFFYHLSSNHPITPPPLRFLRSFAAEHLPLLRLAPLAIISRAGARRSRGSSTFTGVLGSGRCRPWSDRAGAPKTNAGFPD